ncbi:MAG: hypothetical protein Q9215_000805 [Flavoplaca cf. flavocitrina]
MALGVADWKPGMRVLKIKAKVPLSFLRLQARFVFSCNPSSEIDLLQIERLPDIISAWTEWFSRWDAINTYVTVRRFQVPGGRMLDICEENGDSMARHIWDGGVLLAAWVVNQPGFQENPQSDLSLSIVELGTGCGMVGLAYGTRSNCRVILTDVDHDALEYASRNSIQAQVSYNSASSTRVLDWSKPVEVELDRPIDFLLVSECIYNPDSISDLVRTISSLVQQSSGLEKMGNEVSSARPQIVVSTKVRHPSEAAFFDLMRESKFEQKQHISIPIHDQFRESTGQEPEVVHIYIFENPN